MLDQLQAALDLIASPYDPLASRSQLMEAARVIGDRLVEVEAENIKLRAELCDQLASAENVVDEALKCGCPLAVATEHREKFPKDGVGDTNDTSRAVPHHGYMPKQLPRSGGR